MATLPAPDKQAQSKPGMTRTAQDDRIWPSLPPAAKDPSLRAGFGAAIQGNMNPRNDDGGQ